MHAKLSNGPQSGFQNQLMREKAFHKGNLLLDFLGSPIFAICGNDKFIFKIIQTTNDGYHFAPRFT